MFAVFSSALHKINHYSGLFFTTLITFSLLINIGVTQPTPKIIYLSSYHQGDQWSEGISRGIRSRLLVEDVALETIYMDSKRQRLPDEITQTAAQIKTLIDQSAPDIVISSDDNAVKYVLLPYYQNASIPFVFNGVNWDAAIYGLPFDNATGMLETSLITSIIDLLSQYTSGTKIGVLSIDTYSERRSVDYYKQSLNLDVAQAYFVNSMQAWESKYLALQQEVDMIILENPEGIEGWNSQKAIDIIQQNASVPIGSTYSWLAPLSLITIAKAPEEQGWWAAEHAMQILAGKKPADIPIATNKQGKLIANIKIANQLGVTFSPEILQTATLIKE